MVYDAFFLHSPPRMSVPVLMKIEYIPNIKIFFYYWNQAFIKQIIFYGF